MSYAGKPYCCSSTSHLLPEARQHRKTFDRIAFLLFLPYLLVMYNPNTTRPDLEALLRWPKRAEKEGKGKLKNILWYVGRRLNREG